MYACVTHMMCMPLVYAWHLWRSEEGIQSPGTGANDGCKLPCRCWEWSPDPWKEQPLLLSTETSRQTDILVLKISILAPQIKSLNGFCYSWNVAWPPLAHVFEHLVTSWWPGLEKL